MKFLKNEEDRQKYELDLLRAKNYVSEAVMRSKWINIYE